MSIFGAHEVDADLEEEEALIEKIQSAASLQTWFPKNTNECIKTLKHTAMIFWKDFKQTIKRQKPNLKNNPS